MRILLSGGGTAGHINPALAIADYIKSKENDTEILFIGKEGGMEQKLVSQAGYNIKSISISGFKRKLALDAIKNNIATLKKILFAENKVKKIIKEFNPDLCIGTGGYVSGPTIKVAQNMGIPTLIHEQNAYPGVTNKILSKKSKVVMLAVPDAKKYFYRGATFKVVGNPLRNGILTINKQDAKKKLRLDDRPVILSFGGSLGARKINEVMIDLIEKTCETDNYQHIHAYGQYGKWFPEELQKRGINISKHSNLHISEYINNMPECMAVADIVISRSGAITISEIEAMGKASILIPSPNVTANHQYHNAMSLVKRKAADMIEEEKLTGKLLIDKVNYLLNNPDVLKMYEKNSKNLAVKNSEEKVYNIIKDICIKNKE